MNMEGKHQQSAPKETARWQRSSWLGKNRADPAPKSAVGLEFRLRVFSAGSLDRVLLLVIASIDRFQICNRAGRLVNFSPLEL